MASSLLVHDPDGINPYGREVARSVARDRKVVLLLAQDAEWIPETVTVRAILPGNRGGSSRLRQALSLAHGMAIAVRSCAFGRADLLVAWSRSAVEDVVFALLARTGTHVVVVEHNPRPRTPHGRLRLRTMRLLRRSCGAVVVHGEKLAETVRSDLPGQRVDVCMHPPFDGWWQWARRSVVPQAAPEAGRLLLLGRPRPDKGLDQLRTILFALAPEERAKVTVRWCGFRPPGTDLPDLSDLVAVEDHSAPSFLPDHAVAQCLADSTAVLAPFQGATQSGSVVLALSAGLPVLAFDDGELATVVKSSGLAPAGDSAALAGLITALLHGQAVGGARLPLSQWRQRCAEEWCRALDRKGSERA